MTGRVFEIREFTLHDGVGVRTTVFFKGCPLRCAWCHNPEGLSFESEDMRRPSDGSTVVIGTDWTAEALADEVARNADIMAQSGGGVTFSGGEPLAQADFLAELIPALRARFRAGGWAVQPTLMVETSGCVPSAKYRAVVSALDFVYQDLKLPDEDGYRRWCGAEAPSVFANLAWLKTAGVPFVVRIPLVPGVNDSPEMKARFAALLVGAPNLQRVELLPYNRAAGAKYPLVNRVFAPAFDETRPPDGDTAPFVCRGIPCVEM